MMPRIVCLFSMVWFTSRLIGASRHKSQQTVLRCQIAAFEASGEAPRELACDRMKLAVIRGSDRRRQLHFALIDLGRN
jgi:transposase